MKYADGLLRLSCLLGLLIVLASCSRQEASAYQPAFDIKAEHKVTAYVVGIHPLHNPKRLMQIYGPILEYINHQIPEAQFKLEPARNYDEFEKRLFAGHYDLAMPNPYQTVRASRHGYNVFAKMGNDEDFRGIILVRKDSGIHEVSDLKGKSIAYPAKTALAAAMLPQFYLQSNGLDVNVDVQNRYVGSQESAIMNVLRGHTAAAATWPIPWKAFCTEYPQLANQLEAKWQTPPLLNNGWVVRKNVPTAIVDQFKMQLLNLHQSADGRRLLARLPISGFEPANNETYLPVVQFLEEFSQHVREVAW